MMPNLVPDPSAPEPDDEALAAPPPVDRPLVLVGMMGSGKSTVGRRLAVRLAMPFFDSDTEIESAAGLSIAEIFERYGEAHFRDGERRVIGRLLDTSPSVIATGGGAFAQPDTRAMILERGLAIWLNVPIPVLVSRVARRNTRPLLHNRDPDTVLRELMEQRAPAYAQAPLHITSSSTPHARAVDAIIAALRDRQNREGGA